MSRDVKWDVKWSGCQVVWPLGKQMALSKSSASGPSFLSKGPREA